LNLCALHVELGTGGKSRDSIDSIDTFMSAPTSPDAFDAVLATSKKNQQLFLGAKKRADDAESRAAELRMENIHLKNSLEKERVQLDNTAQQLMECSRQLRATKAEKMNLCRLLKLESAARLDFERQLREKEDRQRQLEATKSSADQILEEKLREMSDAMHALRHVVQKLEHKNLQLVGAPHFCFAVFGHS
jgi:exonuclease VII large subunit